MKRVAFLDSGPLGRVVNPGLLREIKPWIQFLKEQKIALRVAEITDYELRRNLMLKGLRKSINNLNKYRQTQRFIPITSEAMLEACELWAWSRQRGIGTTDIRNIDADVILVAQARSQKDKFEEIIIVTENPKHISRFRHFGIETWDWKQAIHDCKYGSINFYQESSRLP